MMASGKWLKNLHLGLKELHPFVSDPRRYIEKGRSKVFEGMLFRELLGNWLICAVGNYEDDQADYTVSTDSTGGDGIIVNRNAPHQRLMTEHVMVHPRGVQE
ncbi:hypothetical protein [Mesorhizobium sp. M4B.F.Ca.ET.049.02.1.2]|uniref:hypothetical protein n=1 Tax=Mesorhizobium sp. M4B.F.Ca.ET.049.02.1.2 TaxID=2496752 RepID=UPI000FCC07E1|nr:hypothetical protein [Mesorhizobium sp. M4B.F.Ca.ET.049.02.1.2]RUW75849.1 hypothetical protein EOA31_08255 [Mesorhizobium sp. M4B.F.Ca.ET.049.02.1.2]TIU90363.1 MAG: hypothetical protein E5W03_00885 [Mesorhizobium sp.]